MILPLKFQKGDCEASPQALAVGWQPRIYLNIDPASVTYLVVAQLKRSSQISRRGDPSFGFFVFVRKMPEFEKTTTVSRGTCEACAVRAGGFVPQNTMNPDVTVSYETANLCHNRHRCVIVIMLATLCLIMWYPCSTYDVICKCLNMLGRKADGRRKGEFWHQHQHSFVVPILYKSLADRDTFAEQQSNKHADQNKFKSNS